MICYKCIYGYIFLNLKRLLQVNVLWPHGLHGVIDKNIRKIYMLPCHCKDFQLRVRDVLVYKDV